MWNDQNGQQGGGGFFNSPNQFGAANTPGNKTKKSGKRSSRTAPLVIRQILRSGEESVKLWGHDIQIACVVARIRNIKMQSTKIVYTIEDITGRMKAVLFIDQETMQDDDDKSIPNVMINTYVQIFGNVKMSQGKKMLTVFKMLNVTNMNAITFHYLQCINNKIKMEAKSKGPKTNGDVSMSTSVMPSNSMVTGMDMGGAVAGLNPRQTMVFNLIRAAKVDKGANKTDMANALKGKMSSMEMEKILEWMCGEGHIYSTIDEDHFRATDAS